MTYGQGKNMPSGCVEVTNTPCQDSIGLFFSFSPDYSAVCDVVFDILKINHNDIVGFQQLSREKYVLKFSKSAAFHFFVNVMMRKMLI